MEGLGEDALFIPVAGEVLAMGEADALPFEGLEGAAMGAGDEVDLGVAFIVGGVDGAAFPFGFAEVDLEGVVIGGLEAFGAEVEGGGVALEDGVVVNLVVDDVGGVFIGEGAGAVGAVEPDGEGAHAKGVFAELAAFLVGQDVFAEGLEGVDEALADVFGLVAGIDGVEDVAREVFAEKADGVEDGFGETGLGGFADDEAPDAASVRVPWVAGDFLEPARPGGFGGAVVRLGGMFAAEMVGGLGPFPDGIARDGGEDAREEARQPG